MFWIKKLNLSHQARPSRSQPHTGNQEPGVPFLKLLEGKRKQEICSGWGLCGQQHEPSLLLTPYSASQLCVTEHCPGLVSSAQYTVLSALTLNAPHQKSAPGLSLWGTRRSAPAIPFANHQVTWALTSSLPDVTDTPNPAPTLAACSQEEGTRVGLRVLRSGKVAKHQVTIMCVISPLHYRPDSQQSGPCWTVTSLKAETGFSTSLFPLRNLTQSRCLIIPLKLTKNEWVNDQT